MNPPDENPFASPQVASPPLVKLPHRPLSIAAMLLATVLSLGAGVIAFCCSCFPSALLVLDLSQGPDNVDLFGVSLFWLPWVVGLIVGGAAAWGVWKLVTNLARRPR